MKLAIAALCIGILLCIGSGWSIAKLQSQRDADITIAEEGMAIMFIIGVMFIVAGGIGIFIS